MSPHFSPGVGVVLSADIAVPEHQKEMRFYSRVLSTGEDPLWREDLMNNLGMPVIGLGERHEQYAHLPLQWMPHIQVADVGASAEKAVELGGTELMHAEDDDGQSQWAVLLDPNGAAFGIIPLVPAEAIPAAGDAASGTDVSVGRIGWMDLTVADASGVRDFYRQVVGWWVEPFPMVDGDDAYDDYNMLDGDGNPAAGLCNARGVNADLPPVWMLYLPVGDLAESLRRVEEEGGTILKTARRADGQYGYAAVRDPVGACLALVPA